MQSFLKTVFTFTSRGPKLSPALLHLLSAKTYETCVDSHGLRYSLIHTNPKRDTWIETSINNWNQSQSSNEAKIQFQNLPFEGNIISFTKAAGDTANDHAMVMIIRDYAERKDATYERWDHASKDTQTSRNDRLRRDLDIDMVNPGPAQGSRRKRSAEVALDESDDSDEQSAESDQPTAMRLKRTARLIDPGNSGPARFSSVVDDISLDGSEESNANISYARLTQILEEHERRLQQVFKEELQRQLAPQSSVLQDINAKTTEQLSLRQDLEVTRQERDDERLAKRSQAGKMSVVSKDRNELRVKLAQIEAQQQRSIENADVIREVRLGRAEARANDALVLASVRTLSPLGNQADKMSFTDPIMTRLELHQPYMEFSENLEENYSKASITSKRCDVPQVVKFPEFAKMRAFMHGLGVILDNPENVHNLDNSPAKHRFDLALYSGPIYSENTFNKMKQTMERIEEYVCDECSQDDTVYDAIAGDAFLEPEVGAFLMCLLFLL
jgi:hypothetical protein